MKSTNEKSHFFTSHEMDNRREVNAAPGSAAQHRSFQQSRLDGSHAAHSVSQ